MQLEAIHYCLKVDGGSKSVPHLYYSPGWWDRTYPHQVCRPYKIGRSGWYTTRGCATIRKDLNRLEKWLNRNFVRFDKMECKVPQLWKNSPRNQYGLGAAEWESSFVGMDMKVLKNKLTVSQQRALQAKKGQQPPGLHEAEQFQQIRSGDPSHLLSPGETQTLWECCVHFWTSQGRRHGHTGVHPVHGHGGRHAGVSSVKVFKG